MCLRFIWLDMLHSSIKKSNLSSKLISRSKKLTSEQASWIFLKNYLGILRPGSNWSQVWHQQETGSRDWIFLSLYWIKPPLMDAPTIKWIHGYLLRHWHTTCHSLFNSPTINQSIIQSGMMYWLAIHLVNKWQLFWLSRSLTHSQRPVVGQWWRNFQTAHEIYHSRLLNCPAKLNPGLNSAIY